MKRILIVEDDVELLKMYRSFLTFGLEGAKVDSATDGKSALEFINSPLPDLILLDLVLPDIGYVELIDEIAERFKTEGKKPRIIIISGSENARNEVENMPGILGYYHKPQSFQGIVELAKIILRNGVKQ